MIVVVAARLPTDNSIMCIIFSIVCSLITGKTCSSLFDGSFKLHNVRDFCDVSVLKWQIWRHYRELPLLSYAYCEAKRARIYTWNAAHLNENMRLKLNWKWCGSCFLSTSSSYLLRFFSTYFHFVSYEYYKQDKLESNAMCTTWKEHAFTCTSLVQFERSSSRICRFIAENLQFFAFSSSPSSAWLKVNVVACKVIWSMSQFVHATYQGMRKYSENPKLILCGSGSY